MKTTITAKNMIITPGITNRIMKKTGKMERYLNENTEIYVRLTRQKNGQRTAEITVPMDGVTLRAESTNEDNLFVSIDQALGKLERQIFKHRTKLEKRLRTEAFKAPEFEYVDDMRDENAPTVVRHKTFPVRPMSTDDAIIQMEMLGHDFFVFVNQDTERTNILYKRKDGDLGLLEPEA